MSGEFKQAHRKLIRSDAVSRVKQGQRWGMSEAESWSDWEQVAAEVLAERGWIVKPPTAKTLARLNGIRVNSSSPKRGGRGKE